MALTKVQIKEILAKNQITLEDMEAVASSPKLKGFDSIDLSGKGITDDIGLVLIYSKHLGGLLKLNLSNNNLTNDFVKIFLKPEVLSNLLKLNLRSNQITSHVISDLINKYNKALNASPYGDDITTICGISICSSGYSDIPRWVKLADRVQEEYDDCCIMDFEQIVDFIEKNAIPFDFEEESGFEKPFKKAFKLLNDRTYDRCIGGAMAGSDSLVVNKLYAVEDFFYLEHSMEGDKVFEFEKEAFEEADRLESLYEEEEDDEDEEEEDDDEDEEEDDDEEEEEEDDDEDEDDDDEEECPLNLSEEEEKERSSFIAEVEKQCRVRAEELGLPGVEEQELAEDVRLEMVLIPAGKFMMGSPKKENGRDDDEWQHEVTLTRPFYMGKHEVTQEQWESVMGNNPSKTKEAKFPVTNVSWEDCQEFIKKLNASTKGGYRLPYEAEWEFACRAGTTTAYSFGDEITPKDANYCYSKLGKPVAVGSYKPNAFGLYDMHGNVFEWCEDRYGRYPYPARALTDPKGAAMGTNCVYRGGSFYNSGCGARSSFRNSSTPTFQSGNYGFRLVRTK